MKSALVIDDDSDVRSTLFRVLVTSGIEDVRVAATAGQGIDYMRTREADLVITDIIMPRVDGIAVIVTLRREFPQAIVIAISGGGGIGADSYRPQSVNTSAFLAVAQNAGAHAVLAKPFNSRELLQAIQRARQSVPAMVWSTQHDE